jgi:hypothetical protein
VSITEFYVSTTGGGAHDGTSEANAWTLSEAITANNALGAGGAAGRRYNVKGAHTARGASDTISRGGSGTSPAIWRGYNSTIGDLDNGTRDQYGVLDTTNFPDIGYNSTFGMTLSESHIILMNLDIAPNRNAAGLNASTTSATTLQNCRIVNSNTGGSTYAIHLGLGSRTVNCDLSSGASSGSGAANLEEAQSIIGCRVTSPGAIGIRCSQTGIFSIESCTIFGCGTSGIATISVGTAIRVSNSTIYGCVDGIDVMSTANAIITIVGNEITDNSGWGIDFNGGTSGASALVAGNRFRDNVSGNTNGFADYVTGTNCRNITTDTGGASTDYTDAATNKDFSIVYNSPGFEQGFSHKTHMGACGFDLPTPAEIGAAAWNNTTSPSRTLS